MADVEGISNRSTVEIEKRSFDEVSRDGSNEGEGGTSNQLHQCIEERGSFVGCKKHRGMYTEGCPRCGYLKRMQFKMFPNPERERLRQLLSAVRRKHYRLRLYSNRVGTRTEMAKKLRKLEKVTSKQLSNCAPYVTRNGEEVWYRKHWKRREERE